MYQQQTTVRQFHLNAFNSNPNLKKKTTTTNSPVYKQPVYALKMDSAMSETQTANH